MSGFSDMLVYLRKRSGLSQQELADRLGVTRSRIGMYETAKREPDFEGLEAIAGYFNVNMDTLLGKETPAPISEGERPDPTIARIMDIVRQLPPDTQERCLEYFESLLALQNTTQAPRTPD